MGNGNIFANGTGQFESTKQTDLPVGQISRRPFGPSGDSSDGRIEMQTSQHRGIDGGKDDELDDQGRIERQPLNIDVNERDEQRDGHGRADIVVMRVIEFAAGKERRLAKSRSPDRVSRASDMFQSEDQKRLVPQTGFEPVTPSLRIRGSVIY